MVIAERKVKKRSITCVVGGREKRGGKAPIQTRVRSEGIFAYQASRRVGWRKGWYGRVWGLCAFHRQIVDCVGEKRRPLAS